MKKIGLILVGLIFAGNIFAAQNSTFGQIKNFMQSSAACPPVVSPSDPNFCASFTTATECGCQQHGGGSVCSNMKYIYNAMISAYNGNITAACQANAGSQWQECVTDWNAWNSKCPK